MRFGVPIKHVPECLYRVVLAKENGTTLLAKVMVGFDFGYIVFIINSFVLLN